MLGQPYMSLTSNKEEKGTQKNKVKEGEEVTTE
jgi:hypothetical protein